MSKKRKNTTTVNLRKGNNFLKDTTSKERKEPTEEEIDAEIKKSKLSFYDAREKLRNKNGS